MTAWRSCTVGELRRSRRASARLRPAGDAVRGAVPGRVQPPSRHTRRKAADPCPTGTPSARDSGVMPDSPQLIRQVGVRPGKGPADAGRPPESVAVRRDQPRECHGGFRGVSRARLRSTASRPRGAAAFTSWPKTSTTWTALRPGDKVLATWLVEHGFALPAEDAASPADSDDEARRARRKKSRVSTESDPPASTPRIDSALLRGLTQRRHAATPVVENNRGRCGTGWRCPPCWRPVAS